MKLSKHMVEKPWGRTDIEARFGVPAGQRIGEIWFEGPGGKDLTLLVKWLFTSEKLSIQVHPSDEEARARGLDSGKEECWYIVSAQPGAVLGIGTKEPLTPEKMRTASLDGSIEAMMDWKPVKAGDYFYIPAGTVHAIGAGISLVEVQQYADITYRLYDYGRPRELHLEDGVAVSKPVPYCDARSGRASGTVQLVEGPHFRLWLVEDVMALAELPADGVRYVVPLRGEARAGNDSAGIGECLLTGHGDQISMDDGSRILVAMV